MHFFTPKAIQNLCQQYGLKPSKDYGQNYLLSLEPIEAMIAAAEIKKTNTVVEIGPGFGALTFGLAEAAGKVIAFEIEKKIKPYWDEKLKEYPNVEIVWGNVLRQVKSQKSKVKSDSEWTNEDSSSARASLGMTIYEPYKVIANIPYQITSPLIKFFLEDVANKPESLTLMVQKEVAQRICAKPGEMSVLAVAVQYFAEPKIICQVPRHFFYPVPEVDSAVVKITLRNPTPALPFLQREGNGAIAPPDKGETKRGTRIGHEQFFKLVKTGFSSRRKILIKNLLPAVGGNSGLKILEDFWEKNGWLRTIRAQELSVDNWGYLFSYLAEKNVI